MFANAFGTYLWGLLYEKYGIISFVISTFFSGMALFMFTFVVTSLGEENFHRTNLVCDKFAGKSQSEIQETKENYSVVDIPMSNLASKRSNSTIAQIEQTSVDPSRTNIRHNDSKNQKPGPPEMNTQAARPHP